MYTYMYIFNAMELIEIAKVFRYFSRGKAAERAAAYSVLVKTTGMGYANIQIQQQRSR